jgi:hypothetical protein
MNSKETAPLLDRVAGENPALIGEVAELLSRPFTYWVIRALQDPEFNLGDVPQGGLLERALEHQVSLGIAWEDRVSPEKLQELGLLPPSHLWGKPGVVKARIASLGHAPIGVFDWLYSAVGFSIREEWVNLIVDILYEDGGVGQRMSPNDWSALQAALDSGGSVGRLLNYGQETGHTSPVHLARVAEKSLPFTKKGLQEACNKKLRELALSQASEESIFSEEEVDHIYAWLPQEWTLLKSPRDMYERSIWGRLCLSTHYMSAFREKSSLYVTLEDVTLCVAYNGERFSSEFKGRFNESLEINGEISLAIRGLEEYFLSRERAKLDPW